MIAMRRVEKIASMRHTPKANHRDDEHAVYRRKKAVSNPDGSAIAMDANAQYEIVVGTAYTSAETTMDVCDQALRPNERIGVQQLRPTCGDGANSDVLRRQCRCPSGAAARTEPAPAQPSRRAWY